MITENREFYRPFEYPKAYDFYSRQQDVHWVKKEIKLGEDLQNWNLVLTDTEKNVIGGILKGFTQMEILVGDYWRNVATWFPKPEIAMMASEFSYFETIHQDAYAMINEELGLDDFKSFLYDKTTKDKLDYFLSIRNTLEEKAVGLATFSAFAEGVQLFSSFAVLLSFQKNNLMKGISEIVSFSIRDENLHSEAGIWLFNQLCEEYPSMRELCKSRVKEAADTVLDLELKFISNLFKGNNLKTITENQLSNFITYRIDKKCKELGYNFNFTYDKDLLEQMSWFDLISSGREFKDFFAGRVTEYTEYVVDPREAFNL